jgi:hypothetical protein
MDGIVRKAGVVGATTARVTDVTGDNPIANFTRGFVMYYDAELRAKREVQIDANNNALKTYLLSKS